MFFAVISASSYYVHNQRQEFWYNFCFTKMSHLQPAALLKRRLWHRCFPVNLAKFSRTPFLQNTLRRLFPNVLLFLKFEYLDLEVDRHGNTETLPSFSSLAWGTRRTHLVIYKTHFVMHRTCYQCCLESKRSNWNKETNLVFLLRDDQKTIQNLVKHSF